MNNTSSFTQVSVKGSDLLKALIENKQTHDEIFASALEGYYKKVQEEIVEKVSMLNTLALKFSDLLERIDKESGEPITLTDYKRNVWDLASIVTPFPQNQEQEYVRAIRMVEMSANDVFTLTNEEFNCYVLNNWQWRASFLTTNSAYLTGVAPAAALKQF